jgi:hypothetical protein
MLAPQPCLNPHPGQRLLWWPESQRAPRTALVIRVIDDSVHVELGTGVGQMAVRPGDLYVDRRRGPDRRR